MLGHTVLLGSVALSMLIVGTALLSAGMRRRRSSDSGAGGPYGDASGLDIGEGGSHHDSGHDGGHGDGGDRRIESASEEADFRILRKARD